ncbi:MAG: alpha/beta hydrolase [Bdellovibrionales bacterium]|nr:alpha/beta hydrolase [Bdellovibrionales bacterium]
MSPKKKPRRRAPAASNTDGEEFEIESNTRFWQGLAWGPASGIPVLALHGWLDNAASYSSLGPELARRGVRLFAVDLPGHGGTDGQELGRPYHFIDSVAAVIELFDALDLTRVRLLGHSMGAGIASLLAGAFPERIEKLALIEGLGPFADREEAAPERLRKYVDAINVLVQKEPPLYTTRELPDLVRKRAKVGELSEAGAAALLERALYPVEGAPRGTVSWRTDPQLRLPSLQRMTEGQVLAFLKGIRAPSLLLLAEKGLAFDPEISRARQAAVPGLQVKRLPGGHHMHLDDPVPIAEILAGFFR